MKTSTQYVTVRSAYSLGGAVGHPNYYVGRLKVFEDGDVDDVVLQACMGSGEDARSATCLLVERANLEKMGDIAVRQAAEAWALSKHRASEAHGAAQRKAKARPARSPEEEAPAPLPLRPLARARKEAESQRQEAMLDGVKDMIQEEVRT